jgi:hypothetical protein
MKSYKVSLKSLSPYMQKRMDDITLEQWEKNRGPIIERSDITKEDIIRAEFFCYRNSTGQCYIPAEQIRGSLIDAGSFLKSKVGVRSKSMKSIVAALFIVEPEEIILPDFDAIDKRSAVNHHVKGRIIVVRPKWTNWEACIKLNVHENSITKETIQQLFEYAGNYVGIGSFRPTKNGMFGRYEITKMENL